MAAASKRTWERREGCPSAAWLKVTPRHGVSSGDAAIIRALFRARKPAVGSYLSPIRSFVDVLDVFPGSLGVMFSQGINYSSWANCSGQRARLVKTLVPARGG